ncbi:MAG: hypothetical protein QXO70_02330 [Candidatus Pacearchaeota archaeon]
MMSCCLCLREDEKINTRKSSPYYGLCRDCREKAKLARKISVKAKRLKLNLFEFQDLVKRSFVFNK